MTKIKVQTDGGKIRIRLRDEAKVPVGSTPTGTKSLPSETVAKTDKGALLLSTRLISDMENRTESGFRPNEEDVEIVYALSGSGINAADMLHKLTSQTVVEEATEDYVISSVQRMIEHLIKERGGLPKLVVGVHTHPQGVPKPSDKDNRYFRNASETIKTLVPDVNVLFGIHAISSESIRERREPIRIAKNTLKWSSITREHEIAFYTPDANLYEVKLVE